jgi:hypothetical protein
MGNPGHATPRLIAKLIPQCPSCDAECYLATYDNGDAGLVLRTLRCDRCGEDILGVFLRLPSAVRTVEPERPASTVFAKTFGVVCLGVSVVIAWLIVVEFGWV